MIDNVKLLCGHVATYTPMPEPGDSVYCRRCKDYSLVSALLEEWAWKCQYCAAGRRYGQDQIMAVRMASRHWRQYQHVGGVLLLFGQELRDTIGVHDGQSTLDDWLGLNLTDQTVI